jgi:tetratricopeptide (TPR) repeat protein
VGDANRYRTPGRASATVVLALLLAASLGCRSRETPPPLTAALLEVGGSPSVERAAALDTLETMSTRVQGHMRAGARAADALNRVVFGELHFARELETSDVRFLRLGSVISNRRGSALGLAGVYLALGELLGPGYHFAVDAVLAPGHVFVRVSDSSGRRDVELLRGGEEMPESWYRQKYDVPEGDTPAYLRGLSRAEVLAVYDYNLGEDLRRRGLLADAAAAYARAARGFPQLAEAYASLGLVRHLAGSLAEAEEAYQAAWAANPRLPGLKQSLAVVHEAMSRR